MDENTMDGSQNDPFETVVDALATDFRYDLALVVIPLAFLAGLATAVVLGVAINQVLALAAFVGVIVIADVCYRNPPIEPDRKPTAGPRER